MAAHDVSRSRFYERYFHNVTRYKKMKKLFKMPKKVDRN